MLELREGVATQTGFEQNEVVFIQALHTLGVTWLLHFGEIAEMYLFKGVANCYGRESIRNYLEK